MNIEAIPTGWQRTTQDGTPAIERRWRFADFHQTMAFVNAVAGVAHAQDHHPELAVGYGHCTVRYTTHDAGGLTARDLAAAEAVNALPQGQQQDAA
ncbi:MAG: 4a-hydroxytetrahydrobiopterin dehydratase [Ottowia sp.]|nr:4a-hydroxytetrahydrobiopterin dehydratase [Ottowia sp.]MCB2036250.1 4a-hydroxytetrahydrobiopterin dehydratase [Ottowia sp.]MCB2068464.1 4a-hydroxytetrahydrobiopterin dehydratase [Ottowia sp.]